VVPVLEEIKVEGAAEGYVEMLHRYGVDFVFASPGTEFVPVWEFLAKYNEAGKKPLYMNTRHEGLSVSLAKGYYMVSGRPQVLMAHVLTGTLHGAMELKAAYTDQIPLMLLVGEARTHDDEVYGGTPGPHYLSFTEVGGQQRLIQPYMKWVDTPQCNDNILSTIIRGLDIASTDIKGPVMLSLSRELLFDKREKMRVPYPNPRPSPPQADPEALRKLTRMLAKSEDPLIYTRYLGRNRGVVASLVELAELVGTPVFETPGYTNFPTNNPLHMGTSMGNYLVDADLILVIDANGWPPWYPPNSITDRSRAKIVFMDLDPLQLKYPVYSYPADLLIAADSSLALPALVAEVKKVHINEKGAEDRLARWGKEHKRLREEWKKAAFAAKDQCPISPRWLCYCIDEVVDENTILVHETISHSTIIFEHIERHRVVPGSQLEATGPIAHTGLGQGLGVALGAKLAAPEKTVIALEGDGSFNYNPVHACLGLAQEYAIPFLTIIYDNQGYAAMKHHPRYYPKGYAMSSGRIYGVACEPKPDYAKLSEAFGGYGEEVIDPSEVKPALLRALKHLKKGTHALLDVILPGC
jgi:acetolactate synthase-1/2/3 large subunit